MDNTLVRTDAAGRPIVEKRHWSFSQADKFYNCPRKFWHYEVAKLIKEPENPKMKEGFRVHKAMSDYIAGGKPLPEDMGSFREWPDQMITKQPGEKVLVEHRLACTFDLAPCDYFARNVKPWLRAQADLLVINGPSALSVDWKTGAEKDPQYEVLPPNFQLRLTAMLIFLHFPQVTNVTSKYVYLPDKQSTSFEMPKEDLREFIPQAYEIWGGLQKACRNSVFPPRRSGLCRKHCAVTSCEYHGRGMYD